MHTLFPERTESGRTKVAGGGNHGRILDRLSPTEIAVLGHRICRMTFWLCVIKLPRKPLVGTTPVAFQSPCGSVVGERVEVWPGRAGADAGNGLEACGFWDNEWVLTADLLFSFTPFLHSHSAKHESYCQ